MPDRDPLFGPNASVQTEPLSRATVAAGHGDELLARVVRMPEHRKHFPFAPYWEMAPFLLPPAYDKLLGSDPIRDLWQNMHRTLDAYSAIVIIGYSMPVYDGYAYEALGRLLIDYQSGGDSTYFRHRRVPLQLITRSASDSVTLGTIPFLPADATRIWRDGFSPESLAWIDWGEPAS